MTQTEPAPTGDTDWTGRTVYDSDGRRLGRLAEVLPGEGGARWGVVRSTLGRRRVVPLEGAVDDEHGGVTVATDKASVRAAPVLAESTEPAVDRTLAQHYTGRGVLADARALQHERYGGSKVGSAFFGWLVAVGLTVLLGVLAGVVSAALGAPDRVGSVVPVVVIIIAYFAG